VSAEIQTKHFSDASLRVLPLNQSVNETAVEWKRSIINLETVGLKI
jgi:hypothetical protein